MRYDAEGDGMRLELRVLELEDTVAALTRVVGTMTELLGGLNRIAAHYADTVRTLLPLPGTLPDAEPPVLLLGPEPGAGCCGGGCCGTS